ncbi:radical SAM additional 4Fe4S-binding domain-containing protein [Candidatus Magnetomorum sp. HK-1]|nr:radical SAM additional 4Fe4S-binding domain-containing protein [Candidatus Magnetomorum sp. HK-1]
MQTKLKNEVEYSNNDRLKRIDENNTIQMIYESLTQNEQDNFQTYRHAWGKTDRYRLDQPFPLNVYLDINTNCNLQCKFCIRGYAKDWKELTPSYFKNKRIGLDTFKMIIDECSYHGLQGLWFGGGETLIEKNILEMIRYARNKKISDTCIVTNGLLLTQNIIDTLFDIPITRISISVDAFKEETYKKLRGGNYSKLMSSLQYLIDKKKSHKYLPIIRLTFIDLPENKDEKEAFINYWKNKVDVIDIQKMQQFNKSKIISINKRSIKCTFPWRSVMVMADGNVMPCCSLLVTEENTMGNINKNSLKEIWDSNRFESFRQNMKDGIFTETCKMCFDSMGGNR